MTAWPNVPVSQEWNYLIALISGHGISGLSTVSLQKTLQLAKSNDLLLAAGKALEESVGSDELLGKFQPLYRRAKTREKNTHDLIADVLLTFQRAGLPLLTIKSFLPFAYADSNIDIVAVNPKKIEMYRHLLVQMGFVRLHNLADLREPDKEMYYASARGKNSDEYPKLHLHQGISWNGVAYLDLSQVWARCLFVDIPNTQVPVPSLEDELLIMAAHAMFENKFITLGELTYLNWLTNHELDWSHINRAAQAYCWSDALEFFLTVARGLGEVVELNINVEMTLSKLFQPSSISFPFILPLSQTVRVAFLKLRQDIRRGRRNRLPRQLFSYLLVDCLWMYRKARRKATTAET